MAPVTQRLQGKVAIVTGGASGIGAATAKLFVQNGAKVIVADVQDDLGQSLCEALGSNDTVFYAHCDVTSDTDVKNVVNMAVSKFGKLDIMYNNAGIAGAVDPDPTTDNENFKRVFEVNVYGAFLGSKHAARVMIPSNNGVILFTASVASVVAGDSPHAYAVSKHALVGLMKNLCVELGQHGIRVNCISPGPIHTPLLNNVLKTDDKNAIEGILRATSVLKGGFAEVDDIAEAAVYLSSDHSKFVSGMNLIVDGGYSTANLLFTSAIKNVISQTTGA